VYAESFAQDAVPAAASVHRVHSCLFRGDERIWAPFSVSNSNAAIGLRATPKVTPPCRYPKRILHIPYAKWWYENDGEGNFDHLWQNWSILSRWVDQMIRDTERPGDRACGNVLPGKRDKRLVVPYPKAKNPNQHQENWLAVERWSRQFCWSKPLHIPFKKPQSAYHEEQNWTTLMRWVKVVVEKGRSLHTGCPGQA
jgi:hypothetical protein